MAGFLDNIQVPQAGGFDAILNNPMQGVQAPVPQSPDEVNARKSQWGQLLEDPNMKSALFRMGLQMMRGTRQGENGLQATARAGMDAMDFYAGRNELDRKRALEQKRLELDEKSTNANVDNTKARTQNTEVDTAKDEAALAEWKTQSGLRQKQLEQQVANLERQGKLDDARILKADFENQELKLKADFIKANPHLAEGMLRATMLKPEAELNQTYAQTGNTEAQMARTYNLSDIESAQENRDSQVWDSMSPDERKASKLGGGIKASGGTAGTAGGNEFTAQAEAIIRQYELSDKKRYPTIDDFITANYNVTLSKSASGVFGEIARLAGTPPAGGNAGVQRWGRDKNGKPVLLP